MLKTRQQKEGEDWKERVLSKWNAARLGCEKKETLSVHDYETTTLQKNDREYMSAKVMQPERASPGLQTHNNPVLSQNCPFRDDHKKNEGEGED